MKNIQSALLFALLVASTAVFADDEGHDKNNGAAHDTGHSTNLGKPGDAIRVKRTVEIIMNDMMRFNPASISVNKGETVRFVLKNEGQIKHEMVLGTIEELKKHAALMLKFPAMEHADPNQASVEPGKTGELVWQFTQAGKFDFACLQPGHYEAGMKGQVLVAVGTSPIKADVHVNHAH